jgi:DNA-binding Lrp family transcriptional regulator
LSKKVKNANVGLNNKSKNDQINQDILKKNFTNRSPVILDKNGILLIQELLKNSDIKSSELSRKLSVPLSTIQRRRGVIERSGFVKRKYVIDSKQFGLRSADVMVHVSKGDCEEIAQEIINKYRKNVLEVSIRIGNPLVNLIATVVYKDSDEIFDIIQHIRRMKHVEDVEWSEIVKTVVKNDSGIIDTIFS